MIGTKKKVQISEENGIFPPLLVHAEEDTNFSKLPSMLKSTLDHLNSIMESDAS